MAKAPKTVPQLSDADGAPDHGAAASAAEIPVLPRAGAAAGGVAVGAAEGAAPTDAAELMADVEARCAALKSWFGEASDRVAGREQVLRERETRADAREADLDDRQAKLKAEIERVMADEKALANDRKAFDAFREAERKKLAAEHAAFCEEADGIRGEAEAMLDKLRAKELELVQERTLLEEEWTGVGKVRRATEALQSEWSEERARMHRAALGEVSIEVRTPEPLPQQQKAA